jgi:hypothetical protein
MTSKIHPNPFAVFQNKFDSLHEVVQTVYVDAGDNHYRVEVCESHNNGPSAPRFVIRYFVKRDNSFVVDDTELPWADGRTQESALAEALGFIVDRHPRRKKPRAS